jgi:hypothetical protein
LRRRELHLSNLRRTPKARRNNPEQLEKGKLQRQQPTWSKEHQSKKIQHYQQRLNLHERAHQECKHITDRPTPRPQRKTN